MNELDDATFDQFARRFARVEQLLPAPPAREFAPLVRRRVGLAAFARPAVLLIIVILLAAVVAVAAIGSRPTPRQYTMTHFPNAVVTCDVTSADMPPALTGDPCIAAIDTIEKATTDIGLPIKRAAIGLGGFPCNDVWATPGPSCDTQVTDWPQVPGLPENVMHAWVSFEWTSSVAAYGVFFYLPPDGSAIGEAPVLSASRALFETPPPGWTFPGTVGPTGLATFDAGMFTFEHPASWQAYHYEVVSSFSWVIVYLANVDVPVPCETTVTQEYTAVDCADRFTLGPDSVVVAVSGNGWPGFDIGDVPEGATSLLVGGLPAYVATEPADPGNTRVVWTISRPDAPADNYFTIAATFRAADALAIRPQLDALIASLRYTSPPTASEYLPRLSPVELEAARLRVVEAVNTDPGNFGVPYLDGGTLVVPYLDEEARAAVEAQVTPGLAVRWEKVEYSRSELRRIASEIVDLHLDGVTGVSSGTNRNRVIVFVVPWGSVDEVRGAVSAYGAAVIVEISSDFPIVLPGLPTAQP